MSIGTFVLWKNKRCVITNAFINGKIIVSPMGNGNNPAKYFTSHERDVQTLTLQCTFNFKIITLWKQ